MEAKYDKIGSNYNQTRKADDFLIGQFVSLLEPKEGLYLDIGCGTGNYTIPIYNRGYKCVGIDPSQNMLKVAKIKESKIEWRVATAEKTGLSQNSISGIIGCMTLHHWSDIEKGFVELYRILKKKGNLVIFTSTEQQMKGYWLNHYFPEMLCDSISQMPSFESIKLAIKNAGFTLDRTINYSVQPELQDQFLYSGKHNPKFYLEKENRNGISSFSSLANLAEVNQGIQSLDADIKSGKINEIIESYKNDLGDYMFIKVTKN